MIANHCSYYGSMYIPPLLPPPLSPVHVYMNNNSKLLNFPVTNLHATTNECLTDNGGCAEILSDVLRVLSKTLECALSYTS